jgi:hypothetical protein
MLLGAFPRDSSTTVVMKIDLDLGDSTRFKYDTFCDHAFDQCATTDYLAVFDSQRTRTVPRIALYEIPNVVPVLPMRVVLILPTIPTEETLASPQATEESPIAKATNTIDKKMGNMMKVFEARNFRQSKVNETCNGGYQIARGCTMQANHPPPHSAMNYPPPNEPTENAYSRLGPNSQPYPWP